MPLFLQVELAKGLGFGELSKSEVLKTYMLDKAYQAVRERTPDLGYTFLVGEIILQTPTICFLSPEIVQDIMRITETLCIAACKQALL